ncbi:hypothetical protein BGZ61DRAFT_501323 [Ilyonectria robusta]|uniref:uncharacterized protein n=1 Tax=Ilyonectria robusta TaxID=1079257 RepID=UPI001E8D901F|nr:uncharacterized protein BGZ61DRAFT_501323 [Ilyonectria robusta]KAH8646425.1 hypothetical protein BGZ61DRAFT_501323 [Ilyonectria robusta]
MASNREVDIPTYDGLKLRGTLFTVWKRTMRHHIQWRNDLRIHFLLDFPECSKAAGFGILTYNTRCWSHNEGTLREEADPWLQTCDQFDVFKFTTSLPGTDPTKVFNWGSSMRVPFVSGEAISRTPGMKIVHISQGRRHAAVSGSAALVPVFPISVEDITNPPSKVVLKDHDALLFVDEMKRRNMQWDEATGLHSLTIVADTEVTTQTHLQLDAFDKVLEPKKLVLLKRGRDFTPDFGDLFVKNSKAQIAFLKSLLPEESHGIFLEQKPEIAEVGPDSLNIDDQSRTGS